MKRILVTTAALIGFAGIAAAQQAPDLYGDYSANVENSYSHNDTKGEFRSLDLTGTASISNPSTSSNPDRWDMRKFEIYTGK